MVLINVCNNENFLCIIQLLIVPFIIDFGNSLILKYKSGFWSIFGLHNVPTFLIQKKRINLFCIDLNNLKSQDLYLQEIKSMSYIFNSSILIKYVYRLIVTVRHTVPIKYYYYKHEKRTSKIFTYI